jgi:hypothetical protein
MDQQGWRPIETAMVELRGESFRDWCSRRGVWPPIQGTPIDLAFARLGQAFVEYVDELTVEFKVVAPLPPSTTKET